MNGILITAVTAYFVIGVLVYALTDSSKLAGKVERTLAFLSYADVNKYVFPLVVALWPLWIFVNAKHND